MSKTNHSNGPHSNDDLTDRLMCALATPLRRRIMTSLMHEPASASTLSEEYGIPLGNVSYQLSKVLFERCGAVKIVAIYQRRGAAEKVYGLEPAAFIGIVDWPSIPASIRSGVHGVTMTKFLTVAIAAIEAEADEPEIAGIYSMQPVAVDRDGQEEIVTAVEDLKAKVRAIAARCTALHPAELRQVIVGGAAFEPAPGPGEENA